MKFIFKVYLDLYYIFRYFVSGSIDFKLIHLIFKKIYLSLV